MRLFLDCLWGDIMAAADVVINEVKAKHAGGRPTKYKPEYVELAYKYCLLSATDADLARCFEVDVDTVYKWKLDYPEFSESIKKGKEIADAEVGKRLYERAMGYSHPEEKIFVHNGEVIRAETVKHYPPDATSAIFWLKNRQPAKWRDTQNIEVSGPGGGPLLVQDVSALSDHDLERLIEIADKLSITGEVVDITPANEDSDN